MALTYPLTAPSVLAQHARFVTRHGTAASESPFTFERQVYASQGQVLMVEMDLPPMQRADAEAVVGFLLALNGLEGTFLMPPPGSAAGVLGTWAGSPLVVGSHAAGVTSIAMDGFSAAATVKAGDWFQVGSGSSTHLHKVVQDATANGSGELTLEIFPRLRATLANNTALDITAPVGLWRLPTPEVAWDIQTAMIYGVRVSAVEAI